MNEQIIYADKVYEIQPDNDIQGEIVSNANGDAGLAELMRRAVDAGQFLVCVGDVTQDQLFELAKEVVDGKPGSYPSSGQLSGELQADLASTTEAVPTEAVPTELSIGERLHHLVPYIEGADLTWIPDFAQPFFGVIKSLDGHSPEEITYYLGTHLLIGHYAAYYLDIDPSEIMRHAFDQVQAAHDLMEAGIAGADVEAGSDAGGGVTMEEVVIEGQHIRVPVTTLDVDLDGAGRASVDQMSLPVLPAGTENKILPME